MMKIFLMGALLLAPMIAQGVDSSVRLAEELVTLRRQVEDAAFQLREKRKRREEDARTFRNRLNELGFEQRRLEKRKKELSRSIREVQAKIREINKNEDSRREECLASIAALRRSVREGVPLQRSARLESLNRLETRLTQQSLTVYQAWRELASILEQEVLLRTQVNTSRQSIRIDGQLVPATVVAFGAASVVFQTTAGDVGYLRKSGSFNDPIMEYQWTLARDPALTDVVENIIQKSSKGSQVNLTNLPLVTPIDLAKE